VSADYAEDLVQDRVHLDPEIFAGPECFAPDGLLAWKG